YWWFWATFLVRRARMIQGVHDVKPHSDWQESIFLKLGRKYMFKWPRQFIFYSKNQKQLFDRIVAKDSHVVFLSAYDFGPPTIDKPAFNNKIKFIFWGSVQYYKGVDLLIEAAE